jgi:hypothetical protein
MGATIAAALIAAFVRVSPFVLAALKPILANAEASLYKTAWPIALELVVDVENDIATKNLPGLLQHKEVVDRLYKAVLATGKVAENQILHLHLGQIALAAYAEKNPTKL